jgi:galactitol-specific phosphotransferase system IIB component
MVLSVVGAMLSYADNNGNNAFPSNELIAFMAGTTVQTVKNTKRTIIKLGLATRELVGTAGNQKSVFTIDLEWNKDKYHEEFNQKFNNKPENKTKEENKKALQAELANLQELLNEDDIDLDVAAKKLKAMSAKIDADKANSSTKDEEIEDEFVIEESDMPLVADYIMSTEKMQNKIRNKEIPNPIAYRKSLVDRMKNKKLNYLKKYYDELKEKQMRQIQDDVKDIYEEHKRHKEYENNLYYFEDIIYDPGRGFFFAKYSNTTINRNCIEYINYDTLNQNNSQNMLSFVREAIRKHYEYDEKVKNKEKLV